MSGLPDSPKESAVPGKVDLLGLEVGALEAFCEEHGEPPYRGRQLFAWIYGKGVSSIEEMSDLPLDFRNRLAECARVGRLVPDETGSDAEGTEKIVWPLCDGARVESVRIPMSRPVSAARSGGTRRWSLCISTQVGCAMGCTFCLTAKMGLVRQLSAGEIVGQFFAARLRLPENDRFHNVVFMGMGEPLDNFDAVCRAARILTHPLASGVAPRRLTVSTVGVASRLPDFVREVPGAGIAVSLNASDDETRGRLMPVNRKWNLAHLLDVCRNLPVAERDRITFEYVLLGGVNDTEADARRLGRLLSGIRCKVNLIPWNPFPGAPFERPAEGCIAAFREILVRSGLTATVRYSKGVEIGAACGQLADAARLREKGVQLAEDPAGAAAPG